MSVAILWQYSWLVLLKDLFSLLSAVPSHHKEVLSVAVLPRTLSKLDLAAWFLSSVAQGVLWYHKAICGHHSRLEFPQKINSTWTGAIYATLIDHVTTSLGFYPHMGHKCRTLKVITSVSYHAVARPSVVSIMVYHYMKYLYPLLSDLVCRQTTQFIVQKCSMSTAVSLLGNCLIRKAVIV